MVPAARKSSKAMCYKLMGYFTTTASLQAAVMYLVKHGDPGLPLVLSAKTRGFYDVIFKILYLAKFHAQMAIGVVHIIQERLRAVGKSSDDIKRVCICTQDVIHPEQRQSLERGIRGLCAILYL